MTYAGFRLWIWTQFCHNPVDIGMGVQTCSWSLASTQLSIPEPTNQNLPTDMEPPGKSVGAGWSL